MAITKKRISPEKNSVPLNSNASALKFANGKKKIKLRHRLLAFGTSFGLSAVAAMGGKALLAKQEAKLQRNVAIQKVIFNEKAVSNPHAWAKICEIYKWNPTRTLDRSAVVGMDNLSRKIGVSPKRLIQTLVINRRDINRAIKKGTGRELIERLSVKAKRYENIPTMYHQSINAIRVIEWALQNPAEAEFVFNSPGFGTGRELKKVE
ncbi:MAG: hypothetical protein WCX33_03435 [Candidatus Shapirobacteria bacterium]|jgi:hypothetical protein